MRSNLLKKYFVILYIIVSFVSSALLAALPEKSNPKNSIDIPKIGNIILQKSSDKQSISTQLILTPSKDKKSTVLDYYEGLEPYELQKSDLDNDGRIEIIVTLRYPESENLIPYVYTLNQNNKDLLEKIFPKDENEGQLFNCREVYFNAKGAQQTLYLKFLVNYHDYAPPELYRLETYYLKNGKLVLSQIGYNEGTHFNLLMNLATEYLHKGKSEEAASLYNKVLTNSTGTKSQQALCEALFLYAEALKYSGKYSEAIKNYEKLVLKYTDSNYTDIAQRELEFLAANTQNSKNIKILNQFFKVILEIEYEHSNEALIHLNQLINDNKDCNFMDRMLYIKAELLVSDNKVDEAMAVFTDIKVRFPNSNLIDYVDEMLENLECKPEDTEGL